MRFLGEDGDDEIHFSALSSDRRRAIGRRGLRHSEQLKEAWRSGLPRLTQKRRGAHTRLQGTRATAVSSDDERSEEDPFNDWFFNGRHAEEAKRPAVVAVKRVQAERHEQCDDDLDCRNSPNQVCVKRARENFGRCQCPYHQPLEVTVNGAVRCTAAKDLFDECHVTEECAATNPHLRCLHRLCVCAPPYELSDSNGCQPAKESGKALPWLVVLAVVVSFTSLAGFIYKRHVARNLLHPHRPMWPRPHVPAPTVSRRRGWPAGQYGPVARPRNSKCRLPPTLSTLTLPGTDSLSRTPETPGRWGQHHAFLTGLRAPATDYGRLREEETHRGFDARPVSEASGASPRVLTSTPILWPKQASWPVPSPLFQSKLVQWTPIQPTGRSGADREGSSVIAFLRKGCAKARHRVPPESPRSRMPPKVLSAAATQEPSLAPPPTESLGSFDVPALSPSPLSPPVSRREDTSCYVSFPNIDESAQPVVREDVLHGGSDNVLDRSFEEY